MLKGKMLPRQQSITKFLTRGKNDETHTQTQMQTLSLEDTHHTQHITPQDKFKNKLVCFTDGSCINNGKPNARAAFAIVWPFSRHNDYTQEIPKTEKRSNNTAEYLAVINAFQQADLMDPQRLLGLVVFTDSQLLINSLTQWLPAWRKNDWKKKDNSPVQNVDLLKQLHTHMLTRPIQLKHVRAHTNGTSWEAIHNDIVDKMARAVICS